MPKLIHATPKYRKHRPSGQAVVTIDGRAHYLGPYRSKTSVAEYDRLIAEWLVNGRRAPEADAALTISEVLIRYWRFAKQHYRKDGKPTSTLQEVRQTLKPLRQLYGHTLTRDFGPLALKAIRQHWVGAGLARGTINKRCQGITRVFKWAVAEELAPAHLYHALSAVGGLQKGRTDAPEPEGVDPVPDAVVQATLPYLVPTVAQMARLQRLTGCRPNDVCILRPCDVDRSGEVWAYRPESHKMEHHGRERIVFIGPKAQDILRPYLLRAAESYCFSPAEAVGKLNAEKRANRKTPLTPSQAARQPKRRPKRKAGERYTRDSYRRAIHRAVELANKERQKEAKQNGTEVRLLPKWSPNRLRHTAATEIRKKFGLEAAQVTLGHAKADVTQVYAERDAERAKEVVRKIG